MADMQTIHAIGRRKEAVCRVFIKPGSGKWDVNGRTLGDYFPRPSHVTSIQQAFVATDTLGRYDVKANVDVAGHTVIEKDANSSMVTNWTVAPAGPGSSVTVKTSWQGAGGIGGFFEKTFAPLGLRKIQAEVLDNLKKQVESR